MSEYIEFSFSNRYKRVFGTEIISIEDFQLDSFNRTINSRELRKDIEKSFNSSLENYLNDINESQ